MQAICLDLGTSGIRGQLLDLEKRSVVRTCMTSRNPIPGANVMDHLSFAIESGQELAHEIIVSCVGQVIEALSPSRLERVSVCGNPIQLSLFEGIEIRDLAYAGENMLRSQGVRPPTREGKIIRIDEVGLDLSADLVIPPAVRHEIGADAMAMMLKTGFLEDDRCMVTDYGTNAEMALKVGDQIFTGSAAAGPALEGQQISAGMLASPGAISDLVRCPEGWREKVLDERLDPQDGNLLNLRSGILKAGGASVKGITGTGVIALVYAGMRDDRIVPPAIARGGIMLARGIRFTERDLVEAGKAIGAIRAGHMTLMAEAGIGPEDLGTMYMAGASGTYVDAAKAQAVGLAPSTAKRVAQVGNTSLELAKDLAFDPGMIDKLNAIRKEMVAHHVMFASSRTFSDLFVLELAYWAEGMPLQRYRNGLAALGFRQPEPGQNAPVIERWRQKDIWDVGGSLRILDPEVKLVGSWECSLCHGCVRGCPEEALSIDGSTFTVDTGRCLGTACRRCQEACPQQVFDYQKLVLGGQGHRSGAAR